MKPIRALTAALALTLTLAVAALAGAAERVNINTADAANLARVLNGVGARKAEAIVKYREENGRFETAADLVRVPGIGLAILDRNTDRIAVSADESGAVATEPQGDE